VLEWQQNVSLAAYNTLALPAQADTFVHLHNVEDIQELVSRLSVSRAPMMVLGGGSNVVLTGDFPGTVIHVCTQGIEIISETVADITVRVAAGEAWHGFVEYCMTRGWYGLENLALIPGQVGGAPIQNIGAYGVEAGDFITNVQAVDLDSGESLNFAHELCAFGYRDSVFKSQWKDRILITSVDFRLNKTPMPNLSYAPVKQYLEEKSWEPSPESVFAAVVAIRQSKLPDPAQLPNVGSFFKNPVISQAQFEALKQQYPSIPGYAQQDSTMKVAAGWLIEQAGFKGKPLGHAAVHQQQALVMVNLGGASSAEVLALAEDIRNTVRKMFHIELEMEPQCYPPLVPREN
jgi:UDP-N-acetylmuramate dehydrogenase